MTNKLILLFIFLTVEGFLFSAMAQEKPYSKKHEDTRIIPKVGAIYGERLIGEIGIYRINYQFAAEVKPKTNRSFIASNMDGFYLSTEILKYGDQTIWGPKVGYELSSMAPTFASAIGLELKYYTDSKNLNSFVFAPKVGIPLQFFNLFYSYNWNSESDFKNITGTHQFQLTFNMDFHEIKVFKNFYQEWRNALDLFKKSANQRIQGTRQKAPRP